MKNARLCNFVKILEILRSKIISKICVNLLRLKASLYFGKVLQNYVIKLVDFKNL